MLLYHNMIIHQMVIRILFDWLSYCDYDSRINDLIVSTISIHNMVIQMIIRLLYCWCYNMGDYI